MKCALIRCKQRALLGNLNLKMAIYHFSGTIISRSQGRSAIACSAYRSGTSLHDNRLDKQYDYGKKQDVAHTEILLPKEAPEWMLNREKLWNSVEQNEKRKDAQLAREFNFALPKELGIEENIKLAREFVENEFVSRGMVADLCIHNDKTPEGKIESHAHLMLTMREIMPDGTFGQKVREWNDKGLLMHWRESWAEHVNRELALNGHDIQVDHRTLKEQGIDLEPQYKIGSSVARNKMVRFADHQRIARENGIRIAGNPELALNAITCQQSTFTHHDVAKFVNRHTDTMEQFQEVYSIVMGCDELLPLGQDDSGIERYTTKTMHGIESKMMEQVNDFKKGHAVSASSIEHALKTRSLGDEQEVAFRYLTRAGDIECMVGYAGTGKSYLLGAAREAWEQEGYRVHGATLSGIAAESLEASSGIESRTLASRLWFWEKGQEKLTANDILVIDEAGMIGTRQMAKVIDEVHRGGAKIVLIGDPEQLQAIEAGAAFRAIAGERGYIELTEVRRQIREWQKEATKDFALGQTKSALEAYDRYDHVHEFATEHEARDKIVELWNDTRIANPSSTQIILASTRSEVREFNELTRQVKRANHELGEDHVIGTFNGVRQFATGDRIYFLKNERSLGVKNGTLGLIEAIQNDTLHVRLDDDTPVKVNPAFYNYIDHGYAATVHKAQAITVDRSYVLASKFMDRHAAYVAMTRHREGVDLFYSQEQFASKSELMFTLSRERKKDMAIDYEHEKAREVPDRGATIDYEARLKARLALRSENIPERRNENEHHRIADTEKSSLTAEDKLRARLLKRGIEYHHEQPADPLERIARGYAERLNELQGKISAGLDTIDDRRELYSLAHGLAGREDLTGFYKKKMPAVSKQIEQLNYRYEHRHEMELELKLTKNIDRSL